MIIWNLFHARISSTHAISLLFLLHIFLFLVKQVVSGNLEYSTCDMGYLNSVLSSSSQVHAADDSPVSGGGLSQNGKFSYGYASSPGKRSSMEDFYETRIDGVDGEVVGLFGVFDGHGGARAAEYVKQNLFSNLISHPKFISDTKSAIADAYTHTDSEFLKSENNQNRDAGSTASTAILVGDRLLVANVGDSRAVICRGGNAIAVSRDHKPDQTDERQRIEDAGGFAKTYASPFLFPPQSSFKNVYNISLIPSSSIRIMNQREWVRLKICVREFMIGVSELTVEFGKGCRDIVKQSLVNQDSFLVRKFGKSWNRVREPCNEMFKKLSFFNQYLPEDKDPLHVWSVIFFVSLLAFSALYVNFEYDSSAPFVKQVFLHPASASRIVLPDGRYMAYKERGVSADRARFSIIAPHTFLSSRLAGIPGVKDSLLEEFGIHLLTYDLPGFGESDPHPKRTLESSAIDMSYLADALGVDKFWVIGYSSGSKHAWAALRYIPDRLAGAAMFAPMVNPYDPMMTKEERRRTWIKWTRKRKFMYFLAQSFPRFLGFFYQRSFLSGKHGQIDRWLSLSLGNRDKALLEDPIYEEFWQRDVEESIRQGNVKPFVEEAALQVSNWGFSLVDLKLQKRKYNRKNVLNWLKAIFTETQEYEGFLGPIHIWQGMDDTVVPPSMTDFVHRVLPGAAVHKLPYEGHFTYIYFCDECHRQIFTTLFGTPQGPLRLGVSLEVDPSILEDNAEQ